MPSKLKRPALVLLCSLSLACAAQVGVSGTIRVPVDGQQQCDTQCSTMGMSTSAVVIMANVVGCVCEPANKASPTPSNPAGQPDGASQPENSSETSSAALAGGMAAIAIQRAQEQQQQQQQQ